MLQTPTKEDFWFLPLGGSGEIGMNLNLYGHDNQWLMVDCGVMFSDRLGIDVLTPDPAFITERRDQLAGLVLTHAHEDHVGAIPYLWPLLRCPIYATAFTAAIVRHKIREMPWEKSVVIHEIPLSGQVDIGKFHVEFVTLTHSIPEPNALAITTSLGTVIHTGDWKLDAHPQIGAVTDAQRLQDLGDQGVLALVCDSTNVFTPGSSGSEAGVRTKLIDVVRQNPHARITVACFASNLARVETAAIAARETGRKVALVGRSLERMTEIAIDTGYLKDTPEFIDIATAMKLPHHEVLIVSTGSQGEPRSALARMAAAQHPFVTLDHRDLVLFSSRIIPGNERSIATMQNNLTRLGVEIVTSDDEDEIHVSGHPARDELKQMYAWTQPQILIPVHGELRHMKEQARLGETCGIPQSIVPENGFLIQLAGDEPRVIDEVPVGRLAYDGKRLIPFFCQMMRERAYMTMQGTLFATLFLDYDGTRISEQINHHGLSVGGEEAEELERQLKKTIQRTLQQKRIHEDKLKEQLKIALRRVCTTLIGKKPLTEIHIFYLD